MHQPAARNPPYDRARELDRREFLRLSTGLAAGAIASSTMALRALAQERPSTPVFVQGHYRPVTQEITRTGLRVRGAIPGALSGRYFRNTHNPPPGLVKGFWFGGQGMIHGVRIEKGRAEWYRNRYVQTPALKGAPLFRKDGSMDLTASAAATSVYAHAGRILALQEVNLPYEITPELDTVGVYDFGGALKTMMTAHPKIDPQTGEMIFLSNSPAAPYLTYHVADATGRLAHSEVIDGPGPSVMHDFAITRNYVIWFDPSVTLDLKSGLPFPYTWNDRYQARIGVMPRDRKKGPVQWIDVPSYYFFHLANAYERQDGKIVVEGTSYDRAAWDHSAKWINSLADHGDWTVAGSRLTRWTLDTPKRKATMDHIDELSPEFPTINYTKLGSHHRYSYAEIFPHGALKNHALAKYDGEAGKRELREFKSGQMPGEPYFVADPQGKSEDDGWLFTYVSDLGTGRSELWILDAQAIRSQPVAVVELPAWVPQGVHGSWIDDTDLRPRA